VNNTRNCALRPARINAARPEISAADFATRMIPLVRKVIRNVAGYHASVNLLMAERRPGSRPFQRHEFGEIRRGSIPWEIHCRRVLLRYDDRFKQSRRVGIDAPETGKAVPGDVRFELQHREDRRDIRPRTAMSRKFESSPSTAAERHPCGSSNGGGRPGADTESRIARAPLDLARESIPERCCTGEPHRPSSTARKERRVRRIPDRRVGWVTLSTMVVGTSVGNSSAVQIRAEECGPLAIESKAGRELTSAPW